MFTVTVKITETGVRIDYRVKARDTADAIAAVETLRLGSSAYTVVRVR